MNGPETIEIIFQHGWGQTTKPFQQWRAILLEQSKESKLNVDLKFCFLDRPYFNQDYSTGSQRRESQESHASRKVIVVTHSLGLHLIDRAEVIQADLLLCLAGFVNWHRHSPIGESLSKRVLERMMSKLKIKPEQGLKDFYERCGQTEENRPSLSELDPGLLYQDLLLLQDAELGPARSILKLNGRALVLQGQDDALISAGQTEELADHLGAASCEFVPNCSHDLPNQVAERGCALIMEFLKEAGLPPVSRARARESACIGLET